MDRADPLYPAPATHIRDIAALAAELVALIDCRAERRELAAGILRVVLERRHR
jgi:hypothetical protein